MSFFLSVFMMLFLWLCYLMLVQHSSSFIWDIFFGSWDSTFFVQYLAFVHIKCLFFRYFAAQAYVFKKMVERTSKELLCLCTPVSVQMPNKEIELTWLCPALQNEMKIIDIKICILHIKVHKISGAYEMFI